MSCFFASRLDELDVFLCFEARECRLDLQKCIFEFAERVEHVVLLLLMIAASVLFDACVSEFAVSTVVAVCLVSARRD